jgi:hypothetical protein
MVNTASGEFQSMPQRTRSLFESLCRKVVSAAAGPVPLADSRRSAPTQRLRWSGNVVNTAAQGQQARPPSEVGEFLSSAL